MGRKLKETVLVEGVVYDAGSEMPDDVAKGVEADVFESGKKSDAKIDKA